MAADPSGCDVTTIGSDGPITFLMFSWALQLIRPSQILRR